MTNLLVIKVTDAPRSIVIEDGDGNPTGGDLVLRVGDRVCWTNATGRDCKLMFRELKLGPGAPSYGGRVWPFEGDDHSAGLNIPASGWCGQVREPGTPRKPTADYVKYDISVTGGGSPLLLDPVIIIER